MTSNEKCCCVGGSSSDDEILCVKCVQERNKSDDTQSDIPATSPKYFPDAATTESSVAMDQGTEPKECHTDDVSAKNDTPRHCLRTCKLTHVKNMIRCCICAHWYHVKCLKLSQDDISGVWPCPDCRSMPSDIKQVDRKIDDMTSLLRDLIQTSGADREERAILHRDINELRQKHDGLLAKNSALETEVKELKHRLNNYFLPTDTRDNSLVLGNSLVRDFDEERLHETEVRCMCGAMISDLTKEVEALKEKSASFSRIVLLAGGNDAAADPDESDVESAIDNYKSLVNAAKEISQNIAITEIPPQFQPPHAQKKPMPSTQTSNPLLKNLGLNFYEMTIYFSCVTMKSMMVICWTRFISTWRVRTNLQNQRD